MFNVLKFFFLNKSFTIKKKNFLLTSVFYNKKPFNFDFTCKINESKLFNYCNFYFFFKYNFKYYYLFKYLDFHAYSFSYNYKLADLSKFKLLSKSNMKLKFLLSLKYLLYLYNYVYDFNIKVFLNFQKLNFLFFNYLFLFVKFYNFFFENNFLILKLDKNNNVFYFKKKRSIKRNRLKKIKVHINNVKAKFSDSIK